MRKLLRNCKVLYYANLIAPQELSGGDYALTYTNPKQVYYTVSAARGGVDNQPFGDEVSYDKVIVTDAPDLDVTEQTVLWVDKLPVIAEDGSTLTPYDYVVSVVARGLDGLTLAVKRVSVNA